MSVSKENCRLQIGIFLNARKSFPFQINFGVGEKPFQTSSNVKIGGALYKQPWWFMKFHIFKSITVFK